MSYRSRSTARTVLNTAARLLLVFALVLTATPVMPAMAAGHDDAAPVLILPINGAQFLPGSVFDIRIEVHAEEMPEDFAVLWDGVDVTEMEDYIEPDMDSWTFGDEENPTTSNAVTWRDTEAPMEPGDYELTVVADGHESSVVWTVREPEPFGGAQNVILFIVDGGTTATYSAARLLSRGMDQGTFRENLVFEDFEEIGFLHTSGMESIITDSANSASAYNTGHKTVAGANGIYPDTSPDKLDDPRVEKFAYMIKRDLGMSVGIVTTSNLADASPNGVFGFGRDRSNSSLNAYMTQPLDEGLFPEVILAGGARNMLPASVEGSRRDDERDLFVEYEEAGYAVVTTASELAEAVPTYSHEEDMMEEEMMGDDAAAEGEDADAEGEEATEEATEEEATEEEAMDEEMAELPSHLLGIFHPNHLNVWLDRNIYTDNLGDFTDQPGLVQMTMAAVEILSQNENGFYLEVEAASVDKQLHPMDYDRSIADMIEMDRTVAAVVEWVEEYAPNTLLIMTSDHAQGFDVFGTVDTEVFNAAEDDAGKRSAIRIYGNAGFPTYEDADGDYYPDDWAPRIVLAQGKVDNPTYTEDYQVSPIPRRPSIRGEDEEGNRTTEDNPDDDPHGLALGGNLPEGSTSSVHTMQSVPVYAHGPGSDCLGRVMENIEVFFCMASAVGLMADDMMEEDMMEEDMDEEAADEEAADEEADDEEADGEEADGEEADGEEADDDDADSTSSN